MTNENTLYEVLKELVKCYKERNALRFDNVEVNGRSLFI